MKKNEVSGQIPVKRAGQVFVTAGCILKVSIIKRSKDKIILLRAGDGKDRSRVGDFPFFLF